MTSPTGDASESLEAFAWSRSDPAPGGQALDVEFSSRGDRATGQLWWPAEAKGPLRLVVLLHAAGGCAADPTGSLLGSRLVRANTALLALDLPLHGPRSSAKLTQKLLGAWRGETTGPAGDLLLEQVIGQAVTDVARGLSVAARYAPVGGPAAVVGFDLGATVAARAVVQEPRLRAAVLLLESRASGGRTTDPSGGEPADRNAKTWRTEGEPRPVLILAEEGSPEADTLAALVGPRAERRPRPADDGAMADGILEYLLRDAGALSG